QAPSSGPSLVGGRIGLDLLDRAGAELPFAWVAGDEEFGRCTQFRAQLRRRRWRYVLDVPCNTLIRDLEEGPAPGRRRPPWRPPGDAPMDDGERLGIELDFWDDAVGAF